MIVLGRTQIGLTSRQALLNLLVEETVGHTKTFASLGHIIDMPLLRLLQRAEQASTLLICLLIDMLQAVSQDSQT